MIRRAVVDGIELRGRTHPEEILPLLKEVQSDPDKKVRRRMIHVLGQISYKKGCLEKVVLAAPFPQFVLEFLIEINQSARRIDPLCE